MVREVKTLKEPFQEKRQVLFRTVKQPLHQLHLANHLEEDEARGVLLLELLSIQHRLYVLSCGSNRTLLL